MRGLGACVQPTLGCKLGALCDLPRRFLTRTDPHPSMSMSDREIWIPPVPALSDIGAFNA
ncbi:hypothetical protein CKY51_05845 [Xanthomonas maliensis]|nr:hypothetical protein CKY51_05845 [Xanthomonas maliensis]